MPTHHVLLIPGFFGFANLGDFAYFGHVRDALRAGFARRRLSCVITVVATHPTAALTRRARKVLDYLVEIPDGDVAHLIGHSSGGIDASLLLSPGTSFPDIDVAQHTRKVKSFVSVSSPHFGAPLAHLFSDLLGQKILRVLSLGTIFGLRHGRIPLEVVLHLVRLLAGPKLPLASGMLLDHIYRDVLGDFSPERQKALQDFLVDLEDDQQLLSQITPLGMSTFAAQTLDPSIRHGSVITCSRPPGLASLRATGFSPLRQSTHALFSALYFLNARLTPRPLPPLAPAQETQLQAAYGRLPDIGDSDGMVPTRSQVWGEIVHAAWADHLDALGHFYLPDNIPPHYDWLNSGNLFTLSDFSIMWESVTRFLLDG